MASFPPLRRENRYVNYLAGLLTLAIAVLSAFPVSQWRVLSP